MRIWRMKRYNTDTPELRAWKNMNSVCKPSSAQRKYYYDKGIQVTEDWKSHGYNYRENKLAFQRFINSVGKREEGQVLGRIDKTKGFFQGNVKWMDKAEAQQGKGPQQKYSYSTDEQLIQELNRRGYDTSVLER